MFNFHSSLKYFIQEYMASLSMIPSITIPSTKKDMWLNINSDKSIISWYNSIYDRRKSKKSSKKKTYQAIENKGWRQIFFDF